MSIFSKAASAVLIVLIGALSSVLLAYSQGALLRQEVDRYPAGATQLHVSGVPEERSAPILAILDGFAAKRGAAIVRVDHTLSNVDGSSTGLRIGLSANPSALPPQLELRFLGTTLFGSSELRDLLAGERTKSIGLDANSADVIQDIPELMFAPRLAVVQLSQLVETTGTINGTYRVVGADADDLAGLLASLEPLTHQSPDTMLSGMYGEQTDGGLVGIILSGFFIAAWLLLLFLLVFEAVRSSRVLGVHLLLGRSRWGFALSLFLPVVLATAFAGVVSAALTFVLMAGYAWSPAMAVTALSGAVAAAAAALVPVAIASLVLVSTKPVDAILGRYSKKLVLGAISGFYVLSVAGFSVAFAALDGPITEAATLTDVGNAWGPVDDQQILYRQSPGDDHASFTGQSTEQARDYYEWYRSIASEPGVTLVNTQHYDRRVLDQWRETYASVPERPFWYMAASPSYLASQGFEVGPDLVARAAGGERVFLLPDTWTASTTQAMRGWLKEDSRIDYQASIVTEYLKDPVVGFEGYSPTSPFFLWNTDPALPQRASDPVILILTPQNMVPFESESLGAIGLENSYVKLSETAAGAFNDARYLARFHLDDNDPVYLPVSEFIAGLTKTIHEFLALFGTVALFLCTFSLIMLLTLVKLFSATYREALAVKRMLGYSLGRLFAPAIVLVVGTSVCAVIAVALAQSKSAILANVVMLAAQTLLLVLLAGRYARLQLSSTLKE